MNVGRPGWLVVALGAPGCSALSAVAAAGRDAGCVGEPFVAPAVQDAEVHPTARDGDGNNDAILVGLTEDEYPVYALFQFDVDPSDLPPGARVTLRLDRVALEKEEVVCGGPCPRRPGRIEILGLTDWFRQGQVSADEARTGVPWNLDEDRGGRGESLGIVMVDQEVPSLVRTLDALPPIFEGHVPLMLVSDDASFQAWSTEGVGDAPQEGEDVPRLEIDPCP